MIDNTNQKNRMRNRLVIIGGTYSNKGGLAIVHGTLKVFKELNIGFKYIIDPDISFPREFFVQNNIIPIYRWSDSFDISSITLLNTFIPLVKCLKNSCSVNMRPLDNSPIWYIGDSSLNDYSSVLSLFGQVINLLSLKIATNGKLMINASMGYMRTKTGKILLQCFLGSCNHFFVRGVSSFNNCINLGVSPKKISTICDFAFYLDKKKTEKTIKCSKLISEIGKPSIALILKYPQRQFRENYIQKVYNLIRELNYKYKVIFVPTSYVSFTSENDLSLLNKLGLGPILDIRDLSPEEIIDVFNNFDAIITTRLHGAVFSTLAGVPTYHIYEADNSLDVIKDVFGDLVPIIHMSDFIKSDVKKIVENIDDLIRRKDKISCEMKACIDINRKRSMKELILSLEKLGVYPNNITIENNVNSEPFNDKC